MTIESVLLQSEPLPMFCPVCKSPFVPFMRGQIQRPKRKKILGLPIGKRQDYCCLICAACKRVVRYESPREELRDVKLISIDDTQKEGKVGWRLV